MIDVTRLRETVASAGSIRAAERLLREEGFDISARTISRRLGEDGSLIIDEPPNFVDVHELIEERRRKFKRLQKATAQGRVRTVTLRSNAPIGIGFMGDAHIDDDGTNIEKLLTHTALFDGSQEGLYAAFLGDVWNNWVGRLTRLWADQSTNSKEAQALVEYFFAQVRWLFVLLGNHDCLDEETEALTRRGWLKHHELRDDDEILSLNPATGGAEWHPILRKIERDNTDEMVTINGQAVDMCVTPNHRVMHQKRKNDHSWTPLDYAPAGKMPARFRIPTAGKTHVSMCELTDDEIRLAGWVLTDGSILHYGQGQPRVSIYQSKDSTGIVSLLTRLGLEHGTYTRQRDTTEICGRELLTKPLPDTTFTIRAKHVQDVLKIVPERGRLPDWAFDLDDRQFEVLLEVLVAADGGWDGAHPEDHTCAVLHKSWEFLSSVQAVAVSHGWRAHISIARDDEPRLNLTKRTFWEGERGPCVARAPASPRVWCLTVPLTNFMVRRNGKAYFTGNCWNGKTDILEYMLSAQTNIVSAHEQRVRLVFPNGREVLIHARHKFPGHSQWTKQFGQIKAAMLGGDADIYVGGDKHVSGYSNGWHDAAKRMWHAIQVASYKEIDDYPVELGLQPADLYQCPVAIIDPKATGPLNFIRWEFDPEEGAKRLAWLRDRR